MASPKEMTNDQFPMTEGGDGAGFLGRSHWDLVIGLLAIPLSA
jgi:hypothetical protein